VKIKKAENSILLLQKLHLNVKETAPMLVLGTAVFLGSIILAFHFFPQFYYKSLRGDLVDHTRVTAKRKVLRAQRAPEMALTMGNLFLLQNNLFGPM
jgi:hypothetical protein